MNGKYFEQAINTIRASWLEIKLAKTFGKKSKGIDENVTVTIAKWRGKYYLIDSNVG